MMENKEISSAGRSHSAVHYDPVQCSHF